MKLDPNDAITSQGLDLPPGDHAFNIGASLGLLQTQTVIADAAFPFCFT